MDACSPAARAWCRSWRFVWRARRISSTSTAWRRCGGLRSRAIRLCIGACVRHAAFHKPVVDGPLGRLLSTVVRHIAHYPIRTRGTFCGSIAHADPASEWCLVAAALGAEMVARSAARHAHHPGRGLFPRHHDDGARGGRAADRSAPAASCRPTPGSASTSSTAVPVISRSPWRSSPFACEDGAISEPRVAVGGVEPQPRRHRAGRAGCSRDARPIPRLSRRRPRRRLPRSIRSMTPSPAPDYRRDLVRTVTRRALEQAAA